MAVECTLGNTGEVLLNTLAGIHCCFVGGDLQVLLQLFWKARTGSGPGLASNHDFLFGQLPADS